MTICYCDRCGGRAGDGEECYELDLVSCETGADGNSMFSVSTRLVKRWEICEECAQLVADIMERRIGV